MQRSISELDRRRFLRGSGIALSLPLLTSVVRAADNSGAGTGVRRLACFYQPDGVPMPLSEDPAYQDWAWFPHGSGREFQLTKCLQPLEPLRSEITVLSGFSHPAARSIHGHSNADQFLTGAATGPAGDYLNSISLDQEFASHVGDQTRVSSLVLSTDGGTGTPRGTHTMSFTRQGRAIPGDNRPKRIFDMLFVQADADAGRRLAVSRSALDSLLEDARSLQRTLSQGDQQRLEDYLQAVRETEQRVEKAAKWVQTPLPKVEADHLKLETTPEEPRQFLQTMYELIWLAFRTDTTRVATWQIGRENGVGISDYLARAVGFNLTHQLTHNTKEPGGWQNFGIYCAFLMEEYGRFLERLRATEEPGGQGSMLDNTVCLFGSASSAFHLSRNYPLVLAGGRGMGFEHGRYLNFGPAKPEGGAWEGGREPWQKEVTHEDRPLSQLFVSMLQRLGVETETFGGITGRVSEV